MPLWSVEGGLEKCQRWLCHFQLGSKKLNCTKQICIDITALRVENISCIVMVRSCHGHGRCDSDAVTVLVMVLVMPKIPILTPSATNTHSFTDVLDLQLQLMNN